MPVDREIKPNSSEFDRKPQEAKPEASRHSLLSIVKQIRENTIAPAVNGFAVEPINAGVNILNGISDATTWATNTLAGTNFKAPEVAKLGGMNVGKAAPGSAAYYSQQFFGTGASFLTYAIAGKAMGKVLREAGELTPLETEIGELKVGTAVRAVTQDARVAQVLGATAYAGLKDPGAGETRLSNAASTFIGFSAFEVGNSHFVNPESGSLAKLGQRYLVGMYGGIAQTETSSLINQHRLADRSAYNASALSGGLLNALIPGGRKMTDFAVDRVSGKPAEISIPAEIKLKAGELPSEKQTSEINSEIKSEAKPETVKADAPSPPIGKFFDKPTGNLITFDPANQKITVTEPSGKDITLSISDAAMKPAPGSRDRGDGSWQSKDGQTMWYQNEKGGFLKADSRDWRFRYGPKGALFSSREGWTLIDNAGHSTTTVDGQTWTGTADPNAWTRSDGRTYEINRLSPDVSTQHWRLANGSERFVDSHGAQWFKGQGETWREVGTWDVHTDYTHAPDGDHWMTGKNALFRDNQGLYWQSKDGGPYFSEDGRLKMLTAGRAGTVEDKVNKFALRNRSDASELSGKNSAEVDQQLQDLRTTQKRLAELAVDNASIKPLSDGGMGHEAYVLNLLGPVGPQRAIFRATDTSEQPGLANTRMRKDLAAQELSARLFDAFPAGVERTIEINGVMRKGWLQDASVFTDHRSVTDLQNELHDLSGQAFPNEPKSAQRMKNFLSGKASDPVLRQKGLQIREALEQVFAERTIFGDLDNHALNFIADFKADKPVVRHIDLDKAMRVNVNEPTLNLNNLWDSGLEDIVKSFSNTKLSAATRARVPEFLTHYDNPAGLSEMARQGILSYPNEGAAILSRARWLRDRGQFPEVRNMYGTN